MRNSTSFNPTPYQGSIYTLTIGRLSSIPSSEFQSNSLSREYLYAIFMVFLVRHQWFQSNSLSREYLYLQKQVQELQAICFNPTPYQGSIYTLADREPLLNSVSGFNPTPYQGSIYTGWGVVSSFLFFSFQSNSLSREYLYVSGCVSPGNWKCFNPTPYQGSIYT